MKIDPEACYEFYKAHEDTYDYIEQRLQSVREALISAPEIVRQQALALADAYAVSTIRTDAEVHDIGLAGIICNGDHTDPAHIREMLKPENTRANSSENTIQFYKNKANWIERNLRDVDYAEQSRLFAEQQFAELHEKKRDVTGLQATKGGWAVAICGHTGTACLDSNMLRAFGLAKEDVDNIDAYEYNDLVAQLRAKTPQLRDETEPFIWQWAVWDYFRDSAVTMHDAWFVGISEAVGSEITI